MRNISADAERRKRIVATYKETGSLRETARIYGVTHERIRQIIEKEEPSALKRSKARGWYLRRKQGA